MRRERGIQERTGVFAVITRWFTAPTLPNEMPDAGKILTRHAEELMRLRGVMSVGLGRTEDGHPAIVLGLENPLQVPMNVPESVEGLPVIHREVGQVRPSDLE